ncbi:phosphotransferase family protein [Catenuloplanes japonicus]|uniref:phosphotransferase family protein n=1 Tax=Catenuloplanes japonicus TaxID=33876 RepID=UPI00069085D0|nr:aminoglycoside phosphotransferase family protein [Catenuloplanes japonicus]
MGLAHGYRQQVTRARIEGALARAGLRTAVADVQDLAGGTFNAVLRVRLADGTRLIVKVAPPAGAKLMRYEHGLLPAEALYYRLAAGNSVPEVVHAEPDLLIMTELPGVTLAEADLPAEARARVRHALGGHLAALHTMPAGAGTGFGYPSGPLHPTWPGAFAAMIDALLADAEDAGLELPRPAHEITALIDAAGLDAVTTPTLVHFDLWDGNILVTPDGQVTGLIDAERAFWGDPVADFASLALFREIADDASFLAGYRAAGGTFGEAEARRLRAYQIYLYLIMWIEVGPRGYPPEHTAERWSALRQIFDAWDIYR